MKKYSGGLLILLAMSFGLASSAKAGVYCNQGEILSTNCGDIDMYGCCDGSAVIFCEPATGNLCKWDCQNNVLTPGGSCYGKCGGYNQYPGGAFMCGCDPNCAALGDCCDDICNDCADIIPQCVDASGSTTCGWQVTKGWYDCMTTAVPGPPGYPMECESISSGCTSNCGGKWCGPDGCGGSCGNCAWSQTCDENGQCMMACEPYCAGKNCGPDGCDGLCGTCTGELTCINGVCSTSCTPDCFINGNVCGPDGCGGSCGYCGSFMECAEGNCIDEPAGKDSTASGSVSVEDTNTSPVGFIIEECPPGQIMQYGICSFIPPQTHEENSNSSNSGGCQACGDPISPFLWFLWLGLATLYLLSRTKRN
jgi:hypothetical protein